MDYLKNLIVGEDGQIQNQHQIQVQTQTNTVQAPEIDPGQGVAAITLLAGGLAVILGRKRKRA
jgi:hypothetical protein